VKIRKTLKGNNYSPAQIRKRMSIVRYSNGDLELDLMEENAKLNSKKSALK
jgi:hypothetical protein